MRKFFLSLALALTLAGTALVSTADAQWRQERVYYYSYPTYSYPAYSYPTYSYYYTPTYSYEPAYYYYGPTYYRWWR